MDQILNGNPDHSLENDLHKKFEGGKTADINKKFEAKTFEFSQHSFDKTFTTSAFADAKKDALGDRVFATKGAKTSTETVIPNADKKFETKKADVKEEKDSHKEFATKELDEAHREYLGPEKQKMHVLVDQTKDVGWQGDIVAENRVDKNGHLIPMTIDQVRELLNKSK